MPAINKVLSIIDRNVQDRVTKDEECLRRHKNSMMRWHEVKERVAQTDEEMETLHKLFTSGEHTSEGGSSFSGPPSSHNGYLATPPHEGSHKSRAPSVASTISRSMSPFRKLARKFVKAKSPAMTPLKLRAEPVTRTPSSEPVQTLRHRASLFNMVNGAPRTPERPSHKYSQSLTPDSSPSARRSDAGGSTVHLNRPRWNSSTKVGDDERNQTIKGTPQRRPSATGVYRRSDDIPPIPALGPLEKRSVSRSSMSSSRPWSPVTSTGSTAQSSSTGFPFFKPASRATTPALALSPRPHPRPKTPSYIPAPVSHWRSMSMSPPDHDEWEVIGTPHHKDGRSPSPVTHNRAQTPSQYPERPPSRSMIPVPSVHVSSASRPSSAMSHYRPDSSLSFRGSFNRALSPEGTLRTTRPSLITRMPPSSYKESPSPRTPASRPPSRSGAGTPSHEGKPVHMYIATNAKDPLDTEVARIVNSIPHGLLIERIDPPLRSTPKEGEEIRASYAFSNSLARKVITCRLATLTRLGQGKDGTMMTKKVMCRIGGGWQDLHLYVLNRQAGL